MKEQIDSFQILNDRPCSTPIWALPHFSQPFEVVVDASGLGIGVVLSQRLHPLEFFSRKLSEARQKWSTYEKELYSLVKAHKVWEHYLLGKSLFFF